MNYPKFFLLVCLLLGAVVLVAGSFGTSAVGTEVLRERAPAATMQDADKFVYADFETKPDSRPVSSRGGFIQMLSYEENPAIKSTYKGMEGVNPPAPELIRTSRDNPNKAISFDYQLVGPNQWAGVGVEIHGQPDKDGKTVADDLSAYKYLALQVYATGVSSLRVELLSRGQGISVINGYPQMTFKVSPGFTTYKIPFKSLTQPQWAEPKVSTKDVLKKLTAVSVTAYCGPCTPIAGTVVVDDIVFLN